MNAPPAALLDARYRVGSIIARGGMSTVYRGVDTRLDRPVAIKIMNSHLAADPAFRRRFEREARSAARIDHPAVVDFYDQGECPGVDGPVTFIVMELVEGGTLREVLRARGAIGVPAAVAVLEPVLAGLSEAHRLGLVHRDVKPENVLISGAGEVKVADFGLVTAAAEAGASHVGMIMGTVAYLSPEQVETGAADARSDVYAAGVLLYELLVGEPPYTGETAISVAYRHVNSDVPAPSLIAGDVPPELDELVRRATRRDPAARPADAGALLTELRRVAEQLQIPAVPVPIPPPQAAVEPPTSPGGPTRSIPGPRYAPAAVGGPGGTRTMIRPDPDPDPGVGSAGGPPPHLLARRRSRRIFGVWVAVVVALALLTGVTAWWLGTGRWTAVPAVVGLQEAGAQQLLTEAGLVAAPSAKAVDDGAAAGVVLASDQAGGTRLLRGTVVTLTVSTGRPTVPPIPAGTAVDAAEALIRGAALQPDNDTDEEYDGSVPEGTVIRSDPAAGTGVSRGATVRLVLSKGPDPDDDQGQNQDQGQQQVRVPQLIGHSFDDAEQQLEELGLHAERQSRFGLGRRRDTVISQDHGPGSMVDRGTTVELTTP